MMTILFCFMMRIISSIKTKVSLGRLWKIWPGEFDDAECKAEFRFNKTDIHLLADALCIADFVLKVQQLKLLKAFVWS